MTATTATPKEKPRRFSLDKMLGKNKKGGKKGKHSNGPQSNRGPRSTRRHSSVTPLTDLKPVAATSNLKTLDIVADKILAEEVSTGNRDFIAVRLTIVAPTNFLLPIDTNRSPPRMPWIC